MSVVYTCEWLLANMETLRWLHSALDHTEFAILSGVAFQLRGEVDRLEWDAVRIKLLGMFHKVSALKVDSRDADLACLKFLELLRMNIPLESFPSIDLESWCRTWIFEELEKMNNCVNDKLNSK